MADEDVLARLDVLEERLAFQEDTIQKLDDAMASQQQQIMLMQRQLELIGEQLKQLEKVQAEGPSAPQDERPPHY